MKVLWAVSALWLATPALAQDARVVLDHVEIQGVEQISRRELEQAVELAPGELLDRVRVVRSAKNIQNIYLSRGFEQVRIESKITRHPKNGRNILIFEITEGLPIRIASAEFVLQGEAQTPEVKAAWESVKKRLEQRLGFSPGMVFDQSRLSDLKLAFAELLTSLDYVGTRVFDPEQAQVSRPEGGAEALRWVALRYRVELGDRVSFGFRGNAAVSRGQLDEIVAEQRSLGLGNDYLTVLSGRIADFYRAQGYAQVKVSNYSYDTRQARERHVSFVIDEGPKVRLVSVDFDGNQAYSTEFLRNRFYELSSDLIQNGAYAEKDVTRATDALIEWIRAQGYLSARLLTSRTEFPGLPKKQVQGSQARVLFYINEGDRTDLESFKVEGVTQFSEAQIAEWLGLRVGAPLNVFALNEGLEKLKTAYRDKGYLGVKLVDEATRNLVIYSLDQRKAEITLRVEEGPIYHVSQVDIEGLEFTSADVVLRELEFSAGDVLEEHLIQESRTKLTRLGIFTSVDIRVQDDFEQADTKRVRVVIEEAGRFILEAGPGFRSDFGVRAFATGTYANAWGLNHTASLNLSTNARVQNYRFIEYQFRANYLWPWIFLGPTSLKLTGSLERWQYITFNADSVNAVATLERRLFKSLPLTAQLSYSLEGVTQYGSPPERAIDNQSIRIGTLTPGLKLDLLDNSLAPTSGMYTSAVFEWASPYLLSQSDIDYTRFNFKTDFYIPLFSKRSVIALSVRTGVERNLSTAGSIPILKQYSLGGVYTVRGFQEQEINIQNIQLGGIATYMNYRVQWDIPVLGNFRVGPFLDAGNLLVTGTNSPTSGTPTLTGSAAILGRSVALDAPITFARFFFGEMVLAAGVALSYVTPIGPLSLSFGYRINSTRPDTRIDISFGRI